MNMTLKIEKDIGFLELNQKDSRVNLLTAETLKELNQILNDIKKNTSLSALVILSAKKNVFIAGADIKEIEKITESIDGEKKAKAGQDVFNQLEDLKIPTIAVIDGVALGGGWELALACQYRLATFNEKIRIGLPEVNLGFIPGFGGTYRLPRLVGLTEGLKLILSGKPIKNTKALRIGLVDRLVPVKGIENHIYTFIKDIQNHKIKNQYPRKSKKGMAGFLENSFIGQSIIFHQSRKSVLKLTKGFYPAPLKAISTIKENFFSNRLEGLKIERENFGKLAITDISKNCVHVFYLSEQYKKLTVPETKEILPQNINKCGIVGAGIMGGGIAQLLSSRDIWVRLKDIHYQAIAQGLKAADVIYKQSVKRRRFNTAKAHVKMAHITGTIDYTGFKNTDIVIEAVVENIEIKKKVFKELSEVTSPKTILASNTSALSITEMAKVTQKPSKVIGFHFFNPVHRMPLVEVITTPMTSKETIVTALALVKRLGKIPILVKDSCGFIVNRILLGYINEAGRILEEYGDIEGIDKIAANFGMPMGPFALSDEVGMDVGIKVLHILRDSFGERFHPSEIFEKIYKNQDLGKKTGSGYYVYEKGKAKGINPHIIDLLNHKKNVSFNEKESIERMVYIMINEASRCLEEGIVNEASAIDVGMIFGTGFPAFRGGLLRYADSLGIDNVIKKLQTLEKTLKAERFKPTQYLLDLQQKHKGFYHA